MEQSWVMWWGEFVALFELDYRWQSVYGYAVGFGLLPIFENNCLF